MGRPTNSIYIFSFQQYPSLCNNLLLQLLFRLILLLKFLILSFLIVTNIKQKTGKQTKYQYFNKTQPVSQRLIHISTSYNNNIQLFLLSLLTLNKGFS